MRGASTLTFFFTDMEDSTRRWDESPTTMGDALERHDAVIATAVAAHGGTVFKHAGDGIDAVFGAASAALAAAVDAQRGLLAEGWKVRIGIHSGVAEERDGDFFGPTLNRCGRLRDAAHGGQVVCSEVTADLARDHIDPEFRLIELGLFRLRGLGRPEAIYQLQAAGLPTSFPHLRVEAASNLPLLATSFVGREGELDEIQKALASARLVTLVGIGGVGKTRLAIEAAAKSQVTTETVWFVDLAAVPDDAMLGGALAQVVGAPGGDTTTPLLEQAVRSLERRRGLVILDNCEHIIDAAADVCVRVLSQCPGVRLLATSREALSADGERTINIRPLVSTTPSSEGLPPAIQLFEHRARGVRGDFRVDDSNRAAVEEICRRLDGLPLAIELAAARVMHMSPQQIATRLDDRFRLLTGPRKRLGRQQTLEAAMDWSYNLLSSDERHLLRALSVFLAPFRLEAAEGMWKGDGDAVDLLGSLVAKSMVVADLELDPPRYRLLETVRTYAWRRLVEADEVNEARTCHREWLIADFEALPRERSWLSNRVSEQALAEYPDIAAACDWSRERGELVALARLLAASGTLWLGFSHLGSARTLLDAALAGAQLEPLLRTECLTLRAHIALMLAEADVVAIARQATEEPGLIESPSLACAWGVRAIVESSLANDPDSALVWHCIDETRRMLSTAAPVWLAWRWGELQARMQLGELDGVVPVAEEALLFIEDRPEYWNLDASLRGILSTVFHIRGDDAAAAAVARPILDDLRSGGFVRESIAFFPTPIGIAFALDGDVTGARKFCRQGIEFVGASPVPLLAGDIVLILAALAVMHGNHEKASQLLAALMESGVRAGYAFVLRSPVSAAIYRHYIGIVRAALSPERARAMRELGRRMSLEEALDYGFA